MRQTELRQVVATVQEALSAAHEQMRERELAAAEMNRRFVEVLAERDELEQRLHAAQTREQTKKDRRGAAQRNIRLGHHHPNAPRALTRWGMCRRGSAVSRSLLPARSDRPRA